jgi:thiol-disulfide isomerase/thioredoxin
MHTAWVFYCFKLYIYPQHYAKDYYYKKIALMKKFILPLLCCWFSGFAQNEPINFKGTIKNNQTDSIAITSMKGTWRKAFAINTDGKYEGTVQQGMGTFYVIYGEKEIPVFLKNDSDTHLMADATNFDETLLFEGKDQKENNFMAQMQRDKNDLIAKAGSGAITNINEESAKLIEVWAERLKDKDLNYLFRSTTQFKLNQIDARSLPAEIEKQVKAKELTGQLSPVFKYNDHKGKARELKDFKGNYVYIDVWATWCGPCLKEIPNLKIIEERYKGKKIAFVSISVDEEKDFEKWKNLVTSKQQGGTQLIADKAWKSDFIMAYGIHSIPRFILIDPKGNVIDADAKRPGDPELVKQLDKILN